MINVLYEDNHIIVVVKECNVPVCEDSSKDKDLLTMIKEYLKEKYNKPGNVYLGLVHRLDRPVGGLMVFARTSKAASRLSEAIRVHDFHKSYLEVVEGKLDKNGVFEDYLKKIESENKTIVDKEGKYSKLSYEVLGYKDNLSLVLINLETGRSHQIRVQYSSRNHPLWGDQKYNKNALPKEQIALWSCSLEFMHPTLKENLLFKLEPPLKEYPWSLFGGEIEKWKNTKK